MFLGHHVLQFGMNINNANRPTSYRLRNTLDYCIDNCISILASLLIISMVVTNTRNVLENLTVCQ